MSKTKKLVIALLCALVLIPISVFGYFYAKMHSMYESEEDHISDQTIELDYEDDLTNDAVLDDNITNILIIGSDGRTSKERGRSDAMMIATIDEKHKSLKLTSLARDTYVKIPGRGYEKLNHAYSYGGAKLLTKTIEENFKIGISHYVNINFTSFIDIIDSLGGVSLDIHSSELKELNKYIPECYEASSSKKKKMELVEKPGRQVLNGYQALSYSRIRKNDDAFQRDSRQRIVIQSILNEVSTMSFGEATKVAKSVFPYVKTNIKPMEMMKYIGKVLKIGNFEIKQLAFPIAEYSKGGILKGKGWVLQFNSKKCLPILFDFIFEESMSDKYLSNLDNNYDNSKDENTDDSNKKEENVDNSNSKPNKDDSNKNDSNGSNNEKPPITNEDKPSKPDNGGSSKPDEDKPTKPDNGGSSKPDEENPSNPDNGGSSKPDEGHPSNPGDGSTGDNSEVKPPTDNGNTDNGSGDNSGLGQNNN